MCPSHPAKSMWPLQAPSAVPVPVTQRLCQVSRPVRPKYLAIPLVTAPPCRLPPYFAGTGRWRRYLRGYGLRAVPVPVRLASGPESPKPSSPTIGHSFPSSRNRNRVEQKKAFARPRAALRYPPRPSKLDSHKVLLRCLWDLRALLHFCGQTRDKALYSRPAPWRRQSLKRRPSSRKPLPVSFLCVSGASAETPQTPSPHRFALIEFGDNEQDVFC